MFELEEVVSYKVFGREFSNKEDFNKVEIGDTVEIVEKKNLVRSQDVTFLIMSL